MAKQRGVVQLSGRVDNLCYYQQKRVIGGLVRRVNLAMGDRVKTDPEYQNLRTANSYFGGCSMCASAILQMTGARSSFLHKGDRQAILTRGIFNLQKRYNVSSIPVSVDIGSNMAFYLPLVYDEIVKNKISKFMPSVPLYFTGVIPDGTVILELYTSELENFCAYNDCIGIRFLWIDECYIYGIARDEQTQKFYYPETGFNRGRNSQDWFIGDGDLEIRLKSTHNDDACRFAILMALPIIRKVGGRVVTKKTGSAARLIGMYQ